MIPKKNHSRWGGSIYMPSKNKIKRENHALSTSQNRNSTCPSPKCDSKDVE